MVIGIAALIGQPGLKKQTGPQAKPAAPGKKPPTTKPANAATIAQLIAELGSRRYATRRAAARNLEAIGPPALTPLREAAAKTKDLEGRHRAQRLVRLLENRLDQLVIDYRSYALPLPPPAAKLVRFTEDDKPKSGSPSYCLAFLLQPGARKTGPLLLVGTMRYRACQGTPVKVVDVKRATKKMLRAYVRESRLDRATGLALAIQCQARGWDFLAQTLLTACLKEDVNLLPAVSSDDPGGAFYFDYKLGNLNLEQAPRAILLREAWDYWESMLHDPNTSWPKAARRLKRLLAAVKKLATPYRRNLLKSLELALVPSKARPGSVPALIDDLVHVCSTNIPDRGIDEFDPRYLKLVDLGFAAVPYLIEHLEDQRLTRAMKHRLNNFPPYHYSVCDVVSDLLQGLAGEDIEKNWLRRQQGYAVEKAAARAWWRKAKKVGEKAYLLDHVLPADPKAEWANSHILRLIRNKYPSGLPRVYRELLDKHPQLVSWPVARAVARSPLPRKKKVALLVYATGNKNLEHRRTALAELKNFDRALFIKLLIKNLDELPARPKKSSGSDARISFVYLVRGTDDRGVWRALGRAARRCDVGLRLDMLDLMENPFQGDRQRRRWLDFLAAFLDDAAVRDVKANPETSDEMKAVCPDFPRVEVRNFAALKIAALLKMSVKPRPTWKPEQWAGLRKQVRQALERYRKKTRN
jgi:hypothetical protein